MDFITPSPRFNVQSATLRLPFWTSSCLLPASTSNPPLFGFLFGLHHAFSPLQRPIRHTSASLLDVLVPSLHAKVHSPPMSLRHREGQQRKQRAGACLKMTLSPAHSVRLPQPPVCHNSIPTKSSFSSIANIFLSTSLSPTILLA